MGPCKREYKLRLLSFGKKGMILLGSIIFASASYSNPVLDHVSAGDVSIQEQPNSTVINQSSQKAIINWHSFNIGQPESVRFQQPAGGVALNRISPTQGPSSIYGRLTATGQIILMNPAGIFFGPTAYVNVGGLIATTGQITDQEFLNSSQYHFTNASAYNGSIINQGQLIALDHGLIALVGNNVQNSGVIQANLGKVVLSSGNAFTMNFDGSNLINFTVDEKTLGATRGITNTGTLQADGGQILVSAKAAQNILDNVINLEGIVEAKSVGIYHGEIILSGDNDAGYVRVAAKINASGKGVGEKGGQVNITGNKILVDKGSEIDVSGDTGGGQIYIGGNYQGKGPLPNSQATVVMPDTKLIADAISNGNGGEIIVWADDVARAYGSISARGGASGGNGGLIETSGKGFLDVAGITIDTSAPFGANGLWLLDPSDLTISTGATANVVASGVPTNQFTADADQTTSTLNATDLTNALANANVTVLTTGGGAGTGNGNITVATTLSWASGRRLTLNAFGNIQINDDIKGSALTLDSDTSGGGNPIFIGANITTSGSQIYDDPVTLSANATLTSTVAGNINFANTLTSSGSNLTLNTAGTTTFGGTVSGLGNLTTDAAGSTAINTASISSSGTQTYNDAVTLGATTALTSTANDVIFANTIAGGGNGLTINNAGVASQASGIISNLTSLIKSSTGTLTLSAANTYAGTTTVNAGILKITNNSGLGTTAGGTTVGSGATLSLNNVDIGAEALTLNGGTLDSTGVVTSTGAITLGTSTANAINSNAGSDLELFGGVNGGGNLTFSGTGSILIEGGIGTMTRIGSLTTTDNSAVVGSILSTGDQTYNNEVIIEANKTYDSSGGNITFNRDIDGDGNFDFTVISGGTTTFADTIGAGIALNSLTVNANAITMNGGSVRTLGNQSYSGLLTLGADTTFSTTGSGNVTVAINNGIAGSRNVTLTGGASNEAYSLTGNMVVNNVTVTGGGGTNSLTVNSGSAQTWNLTNTDVGNITGISGITGSFNYSDIQNLTGGSSNSNNFVFGDGVTVSGTLNGGALTNTNSLNYAAYTTPVNIVLSSTNNGVASSTGLGNITTFTNINNLVNNGFSNEIILPNKTNTLTITGAKTGFINDPFFFSGFQRFVSASGRDRVIFNVNAITNPGAGFAIVNGVTMYFSGFIFDTATATATTTPDIAAIIQGGSNPTTDLTTTAWVMTSVNQNINDIISDIEKQYDEALSTIKINPYCTGK